MKTKSSIAVVALAVLFLLPGLVAADVQSTLYIQGPGGSVLVNISLVVPESCTVQESGGGTPSFSGHKAICALQAAKDTGVISGFIVTDWGFGFSLDSVNAIANASDWSELWQLWVNGVSAEVGIQGIVLSAGDDFQLTYGPWPTGIVSVPQNAPSSQPPGGGVPAPVHSMLNVNTAISFLLSFQNKDGSFGTAPLLSDWAALALSSYPYSEAEHAKDALRSYLLQDSSPGTLLTDYERRAMALMALGVNPYSGIPTNYIQKIVDGFDGEQFGNPDLVNDDIFALLVLVKAGYQSSDAEIAKPIAFLLDRQENNGSFGSVDMTAAAIQALALVSGAEGVSTSLVSARSYLQEQQKDSGGFGNVYATSWTMQAIAVLGESEVSWIKNEHTPGDYLYSEQAEDGGVEKEAADSSRVWATSYAIPAALGKPWGSVLGQFEKPFNAAQGKPVAVPIQTSVSPVAEEVLVLEQVEQEIVRISHEVAALRTEVLAFAALAHMKQELDRISLATKAVQLGIVQFRIQQIAQNAQQPVSSIAEVDLFGMKLSQEEETAPLAAEAKEAVGAQGLSPQLVIILVIIGGAVFAFSGGMNTLFPLLRRTLSKV